MGGFLAAFYSAVTYLLFLGTFGYAVGFVGDALVPKSINSGDVGALLPAMIVDTLLLGLFAVQHSVMARPAFKRWWTRLVPHAVERATYVLLASLTLALLFWQWQPMTQPIWSATSQAGAAIMWAISLSGWAMVLLSTFLINHFELFGLRQVYIWLRGRTIPPATFRTPFLYKHVRHPLYLGFLLAFWATPSMTLGHLLFAVATTGYILIGIYFEERDLIALFGDQYRRYREKVWMLVPLTIRRHDDEPMHAPPVEIRRP